MPYELARLPTIRAGRVVRRTHLMLLGALMAAVVSGGAAAQAASGPNDALKQACAADVRTLCAGIMPGGGRIKKCVVDKHDQLSDGCKSAMSAARATAGK